MATSYRCQCSMLSLYCLLFGFLGQSAARQSNLWITRFPILSSAARQGKELPAGSMPLSKETPKASDEARKPRIPRHLILTGKPNKLHEMPTDIQSNVVNNIRWNLIAIPKRDQSSNIKLRWFGDDSCHSYISEHYDEELTKLFDSAHPGYYRGDICRAAVLYNEGGFYTDVDVELAVPLVQLVDDDTTFMSAFSVNGDIFNGLVAVEPKSVIMYHTLQEIRSWYHNSEKQSGLMGTMTMLRGLEHVIAAACPDKSLKDENRKLQWKCGNQTIRLYQESDLFCFPENGLPQPTECPQVRRDGSYNMRLGFVLPGTEHTFGHSVMGWPRFHSCKDTNKGCGSGGHMLLQTDRKTDRRFLRPREDHAS